MPARNPHVVAVNLLRNYGQHNANLAGFREVTGDYVITMDDDLQNPPDQIRLLIDEAMKGRDVVFGAFESKKSAAYRKLGSSLIGRINRRVFGQPPDLVVSNFRILRRDVVDRICASRTAYPYITGQALMYSSNRSNVSVRHDPAKVGKSRYSTSRIVRLVLTILFSYTLFPLRMAAVGGFLFSILSFLHRWRLPHPRPRPRTPRCQAGPALVVLARGLQRRDDRPAVDARGVRRANPQRRQRRSRPTTWSNG